MRAPVCAALIAVSLVAACDKPPVLWNDPVEVAGVPAASLLVVDSAGHAQFVPRPALSVAPPGDPGLCPNTLGTAAGTHRTLAAWWAVRPDSSAVLRVASSPDSGRTWGKPQAVDTTDVSSVGCTRPAPAITAVGDDVYVAYSMIAPEGKGVFFAHTMGSMLHSPVPVIYGERLVAAAIAADTWHVVVAYEDPNGKHPQVDVALSSTQGHIFELHTTASREEDEATSPAVAFAGPTLAVSWVTRPQMGGAPSRVVRTGRLQ